MALVNEKQTFVVEGKTATLYPGEDRNSPLVVLNTYSGDGAPVVEAMGALETPDCSLLVVVTDEVFSDGMRYDPETTRYLEQLGALNVSAARYAEEVWEVICGIPVRRK